MSERLVLVESDGAGLRAALVENRRLAAIELCRQRRSCENRQNRAGAGHND